MMLTISIIKSRKKQKKNENDEELHQKRRNKTITKNIDMQQQITKEQSNKQWRKTIDASKKMQGTKMENG